MKKRMLVEEQESISGDLEYQTFSYSRPTIITKPSGFSISLNDDDDDSAISVSSCETSEYNGDATSTYGVEEPLLFPKRKVLKPPTQLGRQYSTMAVASASICLKPGELKNSLFLDLNSTDMGCESAQSSARSGASFLSVQSREQGMQTLKRAAGFKKGLSSRLLKGLQSSNNLLNGLANFGQTIESEYCEGETEAESEQAIDYTHDAFDLVSDLQVYGSVMNGYTENDAPLMQEESEELNSAIDQMMLCGFPIIIFNEKFEIEYLNPESEKLFGIHSFVALGENLSKYVDEQSIMDIQMEIERFTGSLNSWDITETHCASHGLPYSIARKEERSRRRRKLLVRDLKLTCYSNVLKKSFPCHGKVVTVKKTGTIHYCLYIQQCKTSEEDEKLMKNKTICDSITELSVIPIIAITQEGIIQVFNHSAVNVFGYQKYEVLGKNIKMLCNSSDRRKHDYYLERYMRTGQKKVIDSVRFLKAEGKCGRILSIETRISEVIDPKSQKSHFIGFIRDTGMVATKEEQLTRITDRIFPKNIAQRLSMGLKVIDSIVCCTLLYCDIVGFTKLTSDMNPTSVIKMLHDIFENFDDLCSSNKLEKIKTIGDCYFLAGGLYHSSSYDEPKHAEQCVKCGFEMIKSIEKFNEKRAFLGGGNYPNKIGVRIGIHTSTNITAAVVGKFKQSFDLFGEGVSLCNSIEANGRMNQLHISEETFKMLHPSTRQLFEPNLSSSQLNGQLVNTFLSKS
ncbi:predicted protein [Naegleria gruberi]|uniref:Predicted protein n=1 Tax=Naegleria gruberi TaxID=5762 RepID=D2VCK6_NAEGR|nr:uncharacterized protein NAEGRDRAFT_48447 [Naegleria gruberi]EFC45431.1 predicted protein [Naegleria gruberi]|eukprot:XP_002678175.1 predicted protein [Naegleria gruberi strain NEG-M]